MSGEPETDHRADPASGSGAGWYVYGIVPAATRSTDADPEGTAELTVLRHREVAALVRSWAGPAAASRRDLLGHASVLDRVAATTPVLPMRFGTVLPSPEAVADDLLAPHHDRLAGALTELAGRAQFTVRARYLGDVALREVVAGHPHLLRLHRQLRHWPYDTAGRARLGELVAAGMADKRKQDTAELVDRLRRHAVADRVQVAQGTDLERLSDTAFLVETARQDRFEAAAEELARHWQDRVRLRLLGPMAPYDFVDEALGSVPAGG